MRRREFISIVSGAAVWPLAASAQQAGKLPTIGYLGANASVFGPWTAAFVARLRELNWIEGRTVEIEYRWSEGRPEREAEIAAEFVRLRVDVIAANGTAVATLKKATLVIPIVFTIANDPVGTGLVQSLASPGGNVTGMTLLTTDLAGKRLELMRDFVPQLRRLAIMATYSNERRGRGDQTQSPGGRAPPPYHHTSVNLSSACIIRIPQQSGGGGNGIQTVCR